MLKSGRGIPVIEHFRIMNLIEKTNTNFIVFGLTRSGLEPTIYRTRGEHANHYTTDAFFQDGKITISLIVI
jgi:hypothetical protein